MKKVITTLCAVSLLLVGCDLAQEPVIEADPDSPFKAAEENLGSWTWIPVEESTCRDGSSTGLGVRLQEGADKLVIFLQGGGACYDAQSCQENAEGRIAGASYTQSDFQGWVSSLGNTGLFSKTNAENPTNDWNHVYVPYCTGDLHGGQKLNAPVDGLSEPQQFAGYANMGEYLKLLKGYFTQPSEVLLGGASAGGFGTVINYPQVASAFSSVSVTAMVDAAPLFPANSILTSCFQEKVQNTFNLQLPEGCTGCNDFSNNGIAEMYNYLGNTYPRAQFGLGSADADLVGVVLLDRESKACGGSGVNIFHYRAALLSLTDTILKNNPNWSSYYWGGLHHTFSQSNALFFDTDEGGMSVAEWLGQYKDGSTLHIAP